MLSFHQSRGRILFEAFCAFAVSASFLGAWTDLGTLAFVPAAALFALYGLVRLSDLRRSQPAATAGVAVAEEIQGDLLAYAPPAQSEPVVEVWPLTETTDLADDIAPEPKAAEQAAKKPARPRRKKAAAATPAVADSVPEATSVAFEDAEPPVIEDWNHAPVAPLFEPEPFVRQQRTVFGRKAG